MRRGLTLIEALILIALTALLLSILLPSLSQSQSLARTIHCKNSERELARVRLASFDDWGISAYDLNPLRHPNSRGGRSLGGPDLGPGHQPTRVGPRGQLQPLTGEGFSEWMELEGQRQRLIAGLICVEGHRFDRNSYGMIYLVRGQPFERFNSMNVIMGCSDYRVVDVPTSFALRHQNRANFLFGDGHVATRHLDDIFTAESVAAESGRMPARPIN